MVVEVANRLSELRRDWTYTSSGMPVWAVIAHVKAVGCNVEAAMADLDAVITAEEMSFALDYYRDHPEEIDMKLSQL